MDSGHSIIRESVSDNTLRLKALRSDGAVMSSGVFTVRDTRFGGQYVKMLAVGGLETAPQFRRQGLVRELLAEGEAFGRERGAIIAILHPFSFAFYRKFGYERVSDTVRVRFPLTALEFVPRYRELTPFTPELLPAYLDYYDRFSKDRNLMPRLTADDIDPAGLYVLRDGGNISGHVILEKRQHFDGVNRMSPDGLYVKQLGFLSPGALARVLGFLRMFEGEQLEVLLRDIGPTPEVGEFLKHYMHTSYDLRPDIMAKVLDVPAVLAACAYEASFAPFTLRVNDETFAVSADTFAAGAAGLVQRVDDPASADLTVAPQALSRLVFGADKYTVDTARYLPGVEITAASGNALAAFRKQINGWFEHF
ncbi:MAG: GNAT family N-acetyltransferase [Clostridia bacterium]|nr:GNAT family N-acetyltransferase [Clostridia bacterium]